MSLEAGVAVAPTSEVGECCSAAASPIPTRHALSPLRDGTLFGALFAGSARVRPRCKERELLSVLSSRRK
jgi:hypothetical protein